MMIEEAEGTVVECNTAYGVFGVKGRQKASGSFEGLMLLHIF